MSALASYFLSLGKTVSGSDRDRTHITVELEKYGVAIFHGHCRENVGGLTELVIYTMAVAKDNPELLFARKHRLPILTVYQLLGLLSRQKYTVVVSGMHGKSTTTSIIGLLAEQAGLDPTVFVGTRVQEWRSNFRSGRSEYFISEACEYQDNFLNFRPDVLVITNVEAEHLDYFGNLSNIKKSFKRLVSQIKPLGTLVINWDDENAKELANNFQGMMVTYGIKNRADFQAKDIFINRKGETEFILKSPVANDFVITLKIPGIFNIYNALASLSASYAIGVKLKSAQKTIEKFHGVWRRFEYKGKKNGIDIYDDYAHHPTEIRATLSATGEKFKNRDWWLIFQPHLYSRTKDFLNEFASALNSAPNLIIAEIYPAREENKWGISSRDLVDLINKRYQRKKPALYFADFVEIENFLKREVKRGEIVMTMGAGEAYKAISW